MMENKPKCQLLVVDDSPENIRILIEILKSEYDIIIATSGAQAMKRLESRLPDLILLDVVMPGMDGYEVCAKIKADVATRAIPVIFLSALDSELDESTGLELGAADYIVKPFSPSIVKARIRNQLELKNHRDRLEELVRERTEELVLTQSVTFMSLGTLAEFRDPETGAHIQRTSGYVRTLCERLSRLPDFSGTLNRSVIDRFAQSAPLHDIGKVGIPDRILLKPGKLAPEEFEIMKTHTVLGYRALKQSAALLGNNSFLDNAMELALSHHERWDGKGYPRSLAGEDIPLTGRIMAVADVYDALTKERPYKPAFDHERSVAIMRDELDGSFDPRIFRVFMESETDFRTIAERYVDSAPIWTKL